MKFVLNERSELTQRIVAAVIGAFIIVSSLIYGEWSYFIVFLFICSFAMLEFYKLLGLGGNLPLKTFGTFNGLLLYILTFLIEKGILDDKYYSVFFVSFPLIYLIKLYRSNDPKPFRNIAYTFLGIVYVGLPFALLHTIIFFDGKYHFEVILGALFILWSSDTGAYFSGRTFGRRKLFERVSPKKTWEGSVGGGVLALLMGLTFSYFFKSLAQWQWLSISMIIVVAGTYGDLVESLFKRSMHIKDSGTSIPGHGGFLDRFDGLLIAAPFIVAFLKLF
ncbi:phosphatidate cytidylyltransferase [Rapidithrix thailandica]|uniref:Phosphatidate cytidylyltransferase n=1 Tax=Rapidithrix thailandica TaxID=413964 RepID=A0AAW9SDU0_9BACT